MVALLPRRIGHATAVGMLVAGWLAWPQPVSAILPDGVIQQLRRLLGLQRPVAVGGTRSPLEQTKLCLLSPLPIGRIPIRHHGEIVREIVTAITPSGTPVIATTTPLVEVLVYPATSDKLDREAGSLLKRWRADSDEPVARFIPWPLDRPLSPGETVFLELRPSGADGGDFAQVRLSRPAADAAPGDSQSSALPLEGLFQQALNGDEPARKQAQGLMEAACRS
ncbi:MAG: hypothetical protein ACK6AD_12770 [Cyanobacteriota bacterium]|jgi:hypothetical protein